MAAADEAEALLRLCVRSLKSSRWWRFDRLCAYGAWAKVLLLFFFGGGGRISSFLPFAFFYLGCFFVRLSLSVYSCFLCCCFLVSLLVSFFSFSSFSSFSPHPFSRPHLFALFPVHFRLISQPLYLSAALAPPPVFFSLRPYAFLFF